MACDRSNVTDDTPAHRNDKALSHRSVNLDALLDTAARKRAKIATIIGTKSMSDNEVHPRRIFLRQVTAVVGAAPLSLGTTVGMAATAPASSASAATNSVPAEHAWRFFNGNEARAVEAAVARIIPTDETGPGATEAGVAVFIDLQLAGAWGDGAHLYRHAPFVTGTPQQGYQLAFTPAEMFRLGFAELDAASRKAHGAAFADLTAQQQDELLALAEQGKLDFGALPSAVFFGALLDAVMEGFFSDPIYGGNRDKIGWKLVGFPGVHASYANDIQRHGVEWTRPPASIGDVT
jgi:gluconate 2-dehydrogenase gamma chain